MEKVECDETSWMYQCQRCKNGTDSDGWYCENCNPSQEVDFDIEENINEHRPDLKPDMDNWKGMKVCPWCYNQLIDKVGGENNG